VAAVGIAQQARAVVVFANEQPGIVLGRQAKMALLGV